MVLSFLRMFRKRKKDYQIKDVVIPDDGNAISHRFSELSCKSSGNGIPCHSSWQCWIRCHVGCCFDTWLPAILSLRTTGCMCQFDALGCPYTQSRMLTYTKDQTFDLKIPWFFWATTRPGFVAEMLWTFQEFFQPWPFWTKLWVDSGRLFISVVVYTLKVCLALTPLLGMAWTHSLKPDEDEPQSESREDIEKLSMLESWFCFSKLDSLEGVFWFVETCLEWVNLGANLWPVCFLDIQVDLECNRLVWTAAWKSIRCVSNSLTEVLSRALRGSKISAFEDILDLQFLMSQG